MPNLRREVLLLNPPGKGRYLRDYYCSKTSKASYLYPPTDLVILSGILSRDHDVRLLDCMVEASSEQEALAAIGGMDLDLVVSQIGAVSLREDLGFLKKVKELKGPGVRIAVSGDCAMEGGAKLLEAAPWLDAIVLDFTDESILAYLEGRAEIDCLVFRDGGGNIVSAEKRKKGSYSIPVPRHELFLRHPYSYPFVKKKPFVNILTDYGCPFRCSFCIMNTLGYKSRPVDDVLKELSYAAGLGVREVYFSDQTFGAVRSRAADLCRAMAALPYRFGWVCFTRVDTVDDELLALMAAAGCHTVILGVESASEDLLARWGKPLTHAQVQSAFSLCKKHGLRTVGTFILGLPGETDETIRSTIDFLKGLECDYVSFNIAVPRARTALRKEFLAENASEEMLEMDQSGKKALQSGGLSAERLQYWHRQAMKSFYLRPRYLLNRLRSIRSFEELRIQLSEASGILRNLLGS